MVDEQDFPVRVQKIGGLVQDLESIADPAVRSSALELVQLLMDLHGTGLERVLGIVFQSGDAGGRVIDELGQDPLVSSLLVLYGLHPDDIQTRIERKLKQIDSKLHKMGAQIELVSVNSGDARIRVRIEGHMCGSTAKTVRVAVEDAICEAAPDVNSLVIDGLEQPPSSGFVALNTLVGTVTPVSMGSEGTD